TRRSSDLARRETAGALRAPETPVTRGGQERPWAPARRPNVDPAGVLARPQLRSARGSAAARARARLDRGCRSRSGSPALVRRTGQAGECDARHLHAGSVASFQPDTAGAADLGFALRAGGGRRAPGRTGHSLSRLPRADAAP